MQNGIEYNYTVSAIADTGDRSDEVSIHVTIDESYFPHIAGQVYSETLAEIFWTYDNVEYHVYRDGIQISTLFASSYLDTGFDNKANTYYVEVVTEPDSRTTLRSASLLLPEDVGTRPPPAPSDLTYASYSISMLELFWARVASDEAIYPLHYEISHDGVLLVITDGSSFVDASVPMSASIGRWPEVIEYRVTTIDANGFRSNPAKLALDIRVVDQIGESSDTSVELVWQQNEIGQSPAGYEIWQSNGSNSNWQDSNILLGTTTATSFLLDGLTPNRRYRFHVGGFADNGNRSTLSSIYVTTGITPQAPAFTNALVYGPNTVELFWTRENSRFRDVHDWQVYRDSELVQTLTGNSWVDDSLIPGVSYEYKVTAMADGRTSAPSAPIVVSTETPQ